LVAIGEQTARRNGGRDHLGILGEIIGIRTRKIEAIYGSPMSPILSRFCEDETAATPIEYVVIVALTAILIVATLRLIGAYLSTSVGGASQALGGGSIPK